MKEISTKRYSTKNSTSIVKYRLYEYRTRSNYVTQTRRMNFGGPLRETSYNSFAVLRPLFLIFRRPFSPEIPNKRDRLTSLGPATRGFVDYSRRL